jgi:uncharacterized protein YllA (UPF0747 family)
MLQDRIRKLFADYDSTLQTVIVEVLALEQEHISYERPRVKDQIDEIITRTASKEAERLEKMKARRK